MKKYGRMEKLVDRLGEQSGTIGVLIRQFDRKFDFDEVMAHYHSLRSLDSKKSFLSKQIKVLDNSYKEFAKGVLGYLSNNFSEKLNFPILAKGNSFIKSDLRKFEDFIIRLIQNMDTRTFGIQDFLNLQSIKNCNPAKYFKIRSRLEDLTLLVKEAKKFSKYERVTENMTFRYDLDLIEHFCQLIDDYKREVFYLKFIKQEFLAAKKRQSNSDTISTIGKLPEESIFIRSIEKLQKYRMTEKRSHYAVSGSIEDKKLKGSQRVKTLPVERIVWEGSKTQLRTLIELLSSKKYVHLNKRIDIHDVMNTLFEIRRMASPNKVIAERTRMSKHSHREIKIKWILPISSLIGLADLLERYELTGKESDGKWNNILVRYFIQKDGKSIKRTTIHMRRLYGPKKFQFQNELTELVNKVSKQSARNS